MRQQAWWQQVLSPHMASDPKALAAMMERMEDQMKEDGCEEVEFQPLRESSWNVEEPRTWWQRLLRKPPVVSKGKVYLLVAIGWYEDGEE